MNNTSSLRDLAVKDILAKIQHGDIQPNEIITESKLCDSLGISRTPVREALIELVANEVLEKVPAKGYKISERDQKYKVDKYVILGELDALAARLSLPHITEQDIRKMNELLDLIDIAIKYENYSSYCDLQEKFHHVYIDKCDNKPLIKLLEEVKSGLTRYTYYSENQKALFDLCRSINQEHRRIVDFFVEKDSCGLENYLINTHWITKHYDMI